LRELVVRNSEKDNEHLHLNVLWPCECIILKKKLQSFAQIRATNQRLIFCGRILKDDETIPETCFATDSADGKEIVPHVWMINVGFSLDRYHLQKEAASKKNIRATSGKIHPDEDLDTEARAKSADVELQAELKLIMWDLIQKVEVKILEGKRLALHALAYPAFHPPFPSATLTRHPAQRNSPRTQSSPRRRTGSISKRSWT